MSNLVDHELATLRRERDEARAEARQYKEQRDDSRDNVTFLSKSIHEMSPQFFEARRLREALEVAQVWLDELREEFRRGALEDNAHRGGYLSNKNVEVEVQARKALAPRDD